MGRQRAAWQHTATLLAQMLNASSKIKKTFKPSRFDPFDRNGELKSGRATGAAAGGIDLLKSFLTDAQRKELDNETEASAVDGPPGRPGGPDGLSEPVGPGAEVSTPGGA